MCSRKITNNYLQALPRLESTSRLTNVPNLIGFDAESNLIAEVNFDYYSVHSFHSNQAIREAFSAKNSFSILHSNIRSLQANFDNFITILSDLSHSFSIIGITESRILVNKQPLSNISIPGYEFISQPTFHSAGGVAFYIKNDIEFHLRDDLNISTQEYECLWIEVHSKFRNLVCAVAYRHPHSQLNSFTNYMTASVDKVSKESKFCALMGDWNINLFNFQSHPPTEEFINTLGAYYFQPHIIKPTRITDYSATLIDVIFFNSIEHSTISGNLLSDLSDHLPNFLIINKLSKTTYHPVIYKRDYSSFDEVELLEEVRAINWEEVLPSLPDVNSIFESFHKKITGLIDKYAPLKRLSRKEVRVRAKPWVTKGLRTSIAIKNKLYKSYLKSKSQYSFSKYKFYRNKLKHLLNLSKKNYYVNYFSTNTNNIKETWNGIKQLISFRGASASVPKLIKIGNSNLSDPKCIANTFNNYFANVGSSLAEAIPIVDIPVQKFMNKSICNSFVLLSITPSEIEEEIDKLNPSKSTGPFSIPTKLLKTLKTLLSGPLAYLFNCSFQTGVVPDNLKLARVIPTFKKGAREVISNYRPISLLSVFHKILERLMYIRLIDFLEKYELLFDCQFGFRTNHSTSHAILLITDKIQKAIESKHYSCGLFLDLSKAFDTVDHSILLEKLNNYGVRGIVLEWFKSYLSNRVQYVSIGNVASDKVSVSCGVPQGSVLGPLLFLLYINDFHNSAPDLDFHLFADDSNLFLSHKSLQGLEAKLNEQLKSVHEWLCCNKLSLNIDKSNFVIFHPPQKKLNYVINLKINNQSLESKDNIKYLGVVMDRHLNWKAHIHELTKKISKGIGILSKLRHFVPTQILCQVYYSIVFPFLTYGVQIWGNTYKSNTLPLVTLQKKAVRIITFSDFHAHTSPIFKALNLLKFYDIVFTYTASFMYQYSKDDLPDNFNEFFVPVNTRHQYSTRLASKASYVLSYARTNYGKFNISFCGPKVWNSIDESLKSSLTVHSFKRKLKSHLISLY